MNVVAHNLLAMNANRQFNITNKNKAKTTEKLSSGYRINRAADDAAGLSISEKMRRQIRGLSQGVRNTEDGVSLCQVADGALAEVTEMLHRITELSIQSANGTYTDDDRQAIQQEISQIQQEIERIGETTEFNERKIFGGGSLRKEYEPLTIGKVAVNGVSTDVAPVSYTVSADTNGFSINGNHFGWNNFVSGSNTLADTVISAGTYTFDYHGLTFSLNANDNASLADAVGQLNGTNIDIKHFPETVPKGKVSCVEGQDQCVGKIAYRIPNSKFSDIFIKSDDERIWTEVNGIQNLVRVAIRMLL